MKHIHTNQKGFGLIEVLLILILVTVVGFAGWYIGSSNTKKDKSSDVAQTAKATKEASSDNKKQTSSVDDKQLITEAVKSNNTDFPGIEVKVQEIQGNFAHGTAGSEEAGGFAYIAKKENGTWSIVFQGQQLPGREEGEKYNLPAGWYSTEY